LNNTFYKNNTAACTEEKSSETLALSEATGCSYDVMLDNWTWTSGVEKDE